MSILKALMILVGMLFMLFVVDLLDERDILKSSRKYFSKLPWKK